MQRVEIARNGAELLDIGFRHGARVARRLPDLEVLDVMGGHRRRHELNLIPDRMIRHTNNAVIPEALQPIRVHRVPQSPHQFPHRGYGMDVMLAEQFREIFRIIPRVNATRDEQRIQPGAIGAADIRFNAVADHERPRRRSVLSRGVHGAPERIGVRLAEIYCLSPH